MKFIGIEHSVQSVSLSSVGWMHAALLYKGCCSCHKVIKAERGFGENVGEKESEQALLIREMLILGNDC